MRGNTNPSACIVSKDIIEGSFCAPGLRLICLALAVAAPPEQICFGKAVLEPEAREEPRESRLTGAFVARAYRYPFSQQLLQGRREGAGIG